jgi:gliding motility-associated-like protein
MDNISWQDSNVFTNVPRGSGMVYVKDAYNCNPISVEITIPNIVNVITPNNDGVNDVLDYSELGHKSNLVIDIFDRYGTKIYQANKAKRIQMGWYNQWKQESIYRKLLVQRKLE